MKFSTLSLSLSLSIYLSQTHTRIFLRRRINPKTVKRKNSKSRLLISNLTTGVRRRSREEEQRSRFGTPRWGCFSKQYVERAGFLESGNASDLVNITSVRLFFIFAAPVIGRTSQKFAFLSLLRNLDSSIFFQKRIFDEFDNEFDHNQFHSSPHPHYLSLILEW